MERQNDAIKGTAGFTYRRDKDSALINGIVSNKLVKVIAMTLHSISKHYLWRYFMKGKREHELVS